MQNMKRLMKKIFSSILITTLFVLNSFAQKGFSLELIIQPQNTWGGEFKVPSAFNFKDNTLIYSSMKSQLNFGIQTGLTLNYSVDKNSGFSIGLLYSLEGQSLDYIETADTGSTFISRNSHYRRTVSLQYLKFPLKLYFNSNAEKNISFFCSAGFYLGLILSYNDVYELNDKTYFHNYFNYTSTGNTFSYNTTNSVSYVTYNYTLSSQPYNTIDLGTTFNGGIVIKLTKTLSLPLCINYQIGLTDIKNYNSQIIEFAQPFWKFFDHSSPNLTIKYHNSLLGLQTGLKIKL
jgi:hypothetical protein